MKKSIFTLTFLTVVGISGFAQPAATPVSPMRIYRMETTSAPVEKTELTKEQEIKQCRDHLEALDTKEAWLLANPEELKKAEDAGWFEDAAVTRARLQARLKELGVN
ncbi:MAG: hypothetical protein IPG07_10245 [Crocinitomicaceae bacterium]|nr:hypothetical protein [Crocinitomicaceae bacterium]